MNGAIKRSLLSGLAGFVTGLGVADDLGRIVVFTDQTGLALFDQEVIEQGTSL